MRKTKWGILGPGKIANKFAQDILLSEGSIFYSVASRDFDRAKEFAEKYQAVKYYGSYEELADDRDVDVVYIASPHKFHFEHSMMCLQKGKAVLCEKPIGMNAKELAIMIETSRKNNLFLMEGMWTRFIPATEKLISLLDDNVIGDILFMHADFGFKATIDPEGRLFNKELGGGSLLDIGIYPVYLSLLCLGMPVDIKAMARMTSTGVDSYCSVLFDFDQSAKAILESTFETTTPTEAILYGTEGILKLHNRFHHTQKITLSKNELNTCFDIPYLGNGYIHQIEEVNHCLQNNQIESPKHPLKMSLELLSLLDRIRMEVGLSY